MSYLSFLNKEVKPHVDVIINDIKARQDPDFFQPFGTQVHCGRQGSGKTISAVHTMLKLKSRYPRAVVVSNLALSGYQPISIADWLCYTGNHRSVEFDSTTHYIHFSDVDELHECLTKVNNGFYGVILLIDEIHTYFNALESKNIPMHVFTEISQQRKQRKLIIGTSQLFMRMAKPLREQCDNVIFCNTVASALTVMRVYDGMELEQDYNGNLIGRKKKIAFFFHDKKTRGSFDTFQKVVSSNVQFEEFQNLNVNKRQLKAVRKILK